MSGSPIEIDLTNSDGENAGNEPRSKGKGRAHPMLPIEIADTPSPAATQAEYDMDDEDIPLPTAEDVEEEDSDLLEVEIITRQEFENHTRYAAGNELPFNHEIAPYAPLLGNGRLEAGEDVELIDGDFLRVTHIVRDKALPRADPLAYILRGILLRRQRSLDNMFSRTTNELAAIILVPMDDNRPHFVSGLEDRPLTSFVCIREIVFTNAIFPQFSFRNLEGAARKFFRMPCGDGPLAMTYLKKDKAVEEARLVCRMKVVKRYIMDGKREKLVSNAFRRLLPDEADPKYRKSPVELFREWREGWREQTDRPKAAAASRKASDLSITSASSRKRSADVIILDDSDDDKLSSAKPSQTPILKTYSLFDFFCGSGGVSEAARLAGLNVKYAIDNQKCAVRTHQKNHRRCTTMHNDVADFIAMVKPGEIQVDVIHSSNPCRYWSFNHTIAGKDDEMNEAIAYTAEEAGKKFRPRIFTFEQTPGLCGIEKHRANWQLFMRQLTSVGYDVEWRVISFADYGNPQARKRLIIFAAWYVICFLVHQTLTNSFVVPANSFQSFPVQLTASLVQDFAATRQSMKRLVTCLVVLHSTTQMSCARNTAISHTTCLRLLGIYL